MEHPQSDGFQFESDRNSKVALIVNNSDEAICVDPISKRVYFQLESQSSLLDILALEIRTNPTMSDTAAINTEKLLEQRAWEGDEAALAELFLLFHARLRRVVDARLDNRLKGRVDPSDVLQEAFIELARKLPSLRDKRAKQKSPMSMFVFMRLVTTEHVIANYRRHIQAEGRDVRRETPQPANAASSIFLAEHLLAVFGSAENKLIRQEMSDTLQRTLEEMDEIDHEIITMRCFEGLTNAEAAEVLSLSENGASSRFVRAISRLKKQLEAIPGFE